MRVKIRDIIFDLKNKEIHLELRDDKLIVLTDVELTDADFFLIKSNKK